MLMKEPSHPPEEEVGILETSGNSHEEGEFFFFNTKPGISQITYVLYCVAVAMVTTFIF